MSDIVERLQAEAGPERREEILCIWDGVREWICDGDRSDGPRMAIEGVLDGKDELLSEAAAEITRLRALADESAKVLEPFVGDNWTTLSPSPESVAAARALYVRLRGEPKRGET